MGFYRCLWGLWVFMGVYRCLRECIGVMGFRVSLGIYGLVWVFLGS